MKKEQSMIDYILDLTEQSNIKHRMGKLKNPNTYERLHVKIDDQLCYCPACNRMWKKNRKMYHRLIEYFPKNHIPTIGKKREVCLNCKGDIDG